MGEIKKCHVQSPVSISNIYSVELPWLVVRSSESYNVSSHTSECFSHRWTCFSFFCQGMRNSPLCVWPSALITMDSQENHSIALGMSPLVGLCLIRTRDEWLYVWTKHGLLSSMALVWCLGLLYTHTQVCAPVLYSLAILLAWCL